MPEFAYTDLLPLGPDATEYRLLTADGITRRQAFGRDFLEVDPEVLTLIAREGMRDIAHLLRPGHLRQLRAILDDPEASRNDRFVAADLLKNACIAAGGVLPMCQDTGTAIVMGKRGGQVLTDGQEGLLVPPGNGGKMASALAHMLDHADERARMGRIGRATAQRYGWPLVADRVLDVYERALWRRSHPEVNPLVQQTAAGLR